MQLRNPYVLAPKGVFRYFRSSNLFFYYNMICFDLVFCSLTARSRAEKKHSFQSALFLISVAPDRLFFYSGRSRPVVFSLIENEYSLIQKLSFMSTILKWLISKKVDRNFNIFAISFFVPPNIIPLSL